MPDARQDWTSRLVLLGIAGLALLNGGCLAAAAAGAAGGGAAALYAYQRGRIYRDYPAALTDATAAVRTSLAELQFAPGSEKGDGGEFTFETKAADGAKVHVFLEAQTSRVSSDGPVTRITVRVGAFGDDAVSARVLDQVSIHLVVPPASQSASAAPPVPRPTPPHPPETAPPPLAAAVGPGK
jgi:Protein of unknown function (DUF3568)